MTLYMHGFRMQLPLRFLLAGKLMSNDTIKLTLSCGCIRAGSIMTYLREVFRGGGGAGV